MHENILYIRLNVNEAETADAVKPFNLGLLEVGNIGDVRRYGRGTRIAGRNDRLAIIDSYNFIGLKALLPLDNRTLDARLRIQNIIAAPAQG